MADKVRRLRRYQAIAWTLRARLLGGEERAILEDTIIVHRYGYEEYVATARRVEATQHVV
ncbi:MAG TPA: hypothetical protein VNA27_00250 [Rubrobacteraceae bacterium]|nr:hypothetical protein [Rubrobacteraceae bacterium]